MKKATPTTFLTFLSILILFLWQTPKAWAVRPLDASIALTAGEGSIPGGFQDGSFTSALFKKPLGLAINKDGTRLYVADSENNCIRVIDLDEDNHVSTIAGHTKTGSLDGSLAIAQFNHPCGILCLPHDRLVVNDLDNHLFRLVDLKAKTVTTLAGSRSKEAGLQVGPAKKVAMNDVRDMAYMPAADSIFFTQLGSGSLKRLDLKSGEVSLVFDKNTLLPAPAALWCQDKDLYVADNDLPLIDKMEWKDKSLSEPVSFAATLDKVLSLSLNGDILYALLAIPGVPAQRFYLNGQEWENKTKDGFIQQFNGKLVKFRSPWGDTIPQDSLFPPESTSFSPSIGFVPDPSDSRKFYVSRPDYNLIVSFRDLFGFDWNPSEGQRNSNGLDEPEYPAKKPKGTYRILIVGDSRSAEIQNYPFLTDYHPQKRPAENPYYPENLSLAPRMTRELNFLAALDDSPLNYEVFNYSRHGETFIWPTYNVPAVVKHNDIDLVIIFMTDHLPYEYYFNHPITSEGIPQYPNDMEYLLKPPLDRIPDGAPRKFYDICKAHGWVEVTKDAIKFDQTLLGCPELQDLIIEMYGKPMDLLNRKLSQMLTSSGQPVRLLLCNMSTCRPWEKNLDIAIWPKVAKKFKFPIWDLNDRTNALNLSFFPLTGDGSHMDPDGADYYSRLFAHELIREKLIPFTKVLRK